MKNRIDRRTFLKTSVATAVSIGVSGCAKGILPMGLGKGERAGAQRPNILFVMTDQESVDLLGCYGNKVIKTPARDAIAAGGVRFTNHYAASYPCSPSRATMITGRYAHNHGIVTNEIMLRDDIPALGKAMSKAGYMTSWVGKSHMGGFMERGAKNFPHEGNFRYELKVTPEGYKWDPVEGGVGEDGPVGGFEHWVGGWRHFQEWLKKASNRPPEISLEAASHIGCHNDAPTGDDDTHSHSLLGEDLHEDKFLTDEAIGFLKTAKEAGKPFCSVLSYYGPHHPVAPPKPWGDMYSIDDIKLPEDFHDSLEDKPIGQRTDAVFVRPQWSEEQFKDYIRRYYGYVSFLDRQLQRVLDTLKELGLEENTIVVFTSDHGDMLGHHGMIHKMGSHGYDQLLKVPLMIRWPEKIAAGQVNESLASNCDLMPTLLDLAGVPVPKDIDGKSMKRAVVAGQPTGRERVFCDVANGGYMVREGDWKYVLNMRFKGKDTTRDYDELYNLKEDPSERRNLALAPGQAKRCAALRERIYEWLETTGYPYARQVREKAETMKPPVCEGVMPAVARFEDLGGGKFRIDYVWNCSRPLSGAGETEDIVRVARNQGNDKTIVWKLNRPTPCKASEWKAGGKYAASAEGVLGKDAKPGAYRVEIGILRNGRSLQTAWGHGAPLAVGELKVQQSGGGLALAFRPYKW